MESATRLGDLDTEQDPGLYRVLFRKVTGDAKAESCGKRPPRLILMQHASLDQETCA